MGLIVNMDNLYDTPIKSVQFNHFKPNLIALGGDDVLIMDISKTTSSKD
jgi:hypothetical protein